MQGPGERENAGGTVTVLYLGSDRPLPQERPLELRTKGSDCVSHDDTQDRTESMCKGPGVEACFKE